jgi:hypothetical protein
MISIEDKIGSYFPDSTVIFPEVHTTRRLRSNLQQRGGCLVLQLHDELLYEASTINFLSTTSSNYSNCMAFTRCRKYKINNFFILFQVNLVDLKEVAVIIKESMENVCQLTVPLPVKVRVGPAWGDLNDYQF